MTDYICPACGGGFPSEAMLDDVACPWCEFMLGEAADMVRDGHWSPLEGLSGSTVDGED